MKSLNKPTKNVIIFKDRIGFGSKVMPLLEKLQMPEMIRIELVVIETKSNRENNDSNARNLFLIFKSWSRICPKFLIPSFERLLNIYLV